MAKRRWLSRRRSTDVGTEVPEAAAPGAPTGDAPEPDAPVVPPPAPALAGAEDPIPPPPAAPPRPGAFGVGPATGRQPAIPADGAFAADPASGGHPPVAPAAGAPAGAFGAAPGDDDADDADRSPLTQGRYERLVAAAGINPEHDLSPHAASVLDWLSRQDDAVCSGIVELLQATSLATARHIESAGFPDRA